LVNDAFIARILEMAMGDDPGFMEESIYRGAKMNVDFIDYLSTKFTKCLRITFLFILPFNWDNQYALSEV